MLGTEPGIQHHFDSLAAFQLGGKIDVVLRQTTEFYLFTNEPLIFLNKHGFRIDQ